MRLTLHTDFTLRVLIQVGLKDSELTTINDIAKSFNISKNHLMKVVNDLGQKGYLDTVRGRNSGIRLMRKPRDINIGQVVRDTEDRGPSMLGAAHPDTRRQQLRRDRLASGALRYLHPLASPSAAQLRSLKMLQLLCLILPIG